jgi:hypothetical protein
VATAVAVGSDPAGTASALQAFRTESNGNRNKIDRNSIAAKVSGIGRVEQRLYRKFNVSGVYDIDLQDGEIVAVDSRTGDSAPSDSKLSTGD